MSRKCSFEFQSYGISLAVLTKGWRWHWQVLWWFHCRTLSKLLGTTLSGRWRVDAVSWVTCLPLPFGYMVVFTDFSRAAVFWWSTWWCGGSKSTSGRTGTVTFYCITVRAIVLPLLVFALRSFCFFVEEHIHASRWRHCRVNQFIHKLSVSCSFLQRKYRRRPALSLKRRSSSYIPYKSSVIHRR